MTTHTKSEGSISIIDAVETLSNIADLDLEHELGIAETHDFIIQNQPVTYRRVHWLSSQEGPTTVNAVRDTFRVVLNYLRHFYKKEYGYVTDQHTVEGIKTIMVLVGEAAKKLDKFTSMFHQVHAKSVTEMKEYKELQEFYFRRIARTIDEGVLGKWILALSQRAMARKRPPSSATLMGIGAKAGQTKHIFIDLDSVKKDTEYELFFLRKEDGTRFFSPRLIRNIKLVCDFGSYFGEPKGDDPLLDIGLWKDRLIQLSTKSLLDSILNVADRFYHEAMIYRQNELVDSLSKAIIALMLSSSPVNQLRNQPQKSCSDYFNDFQHFLRTSLQSRDYQKMIAYPPKKSSKLAHCLLETLHALCYAFFISMKGYQEMTPMIRRLIADANQEHSPEHQQAALESNTLWSKLAGDYAAMNKLMKRHANGPLIKVLDALEEGTYHFFDPIAQENLPSQLYTITLKDQKMVNVHIPGITYQEFIHKAVVDEDFKGLLRALNHSYKNQTKHLIFNLQDRTSWKEHSRCMAVEDLQKQPEFVKSLAVVTLNYDTEFFHQLAPYHEDNQTEVFIQHLKEHITDENAGFSYPPLVKKALFPQFLDKVVALVHHTFFSGKNVLQRDRRLDFIMIVYLFLQLKILELVKPTSFSMTCKDSLDTGGTANALFYAFFQLVDKGECSTQDHECLNLLLYAPALFVRERLLLTERFNRMLSALKIIEEAKKELGAAPFRKAIHSALKN